MIHRFNRPLRARLEGGGTPKMTGAGISSPKPAG